MPTEREIREAIEVQRDAYKALRGVLAIRADPGAREAYLAITQLSTAAREAGSPAWYTYNKLLNLISPTLTPPALVLLLCVLSGCSLLLGPWPSTFGTRELDAGQLEHRDSGTDDAGAELDAALVDAGAELEHDAGRAYSDDAGGDSAARDASTCSADAFSATASYGAGDTAQVGEVVYQCRLGVEHAWCELDTYEPGTGANWAMAWLVLCSID